jgi:hypothetical protein
MVEKVIDRITVVAEITDHLTGKDGNNRPFNNGGQNNRPFNRDGDNFRPYNNNNGGNNRPYNNGGRKWQTI